MRRLWHRLGEHQAEGPKLSGSEITAGHPGTVPNAGNKCFERFRLWDKKEKKISSHARPAGTASASSSIQPPADSSTNLQAVPGNRPPSTQSPWDRAYDTLAEEDPYLVAEYEKLLSDEAQKTATVDDTASVSQEPSRHEKLDTIIARGLERLEENKAKYTIAGHEFVLRDQIAGAAQLVMWAKGWIGEAVKASPEASIAWAGVAIILPLLTNPQRANEANRDGFAYVTARMRYYAALEPLLLRLGQNPGVADALMAEAAQDNVTLYRHILEFLIKSVLRFYQSGIGRYIRDTLQTQDWTQMTRKINELDATVNQNLIQINAFVARQELEALQKRSTESLGTMQQHLSVSEQHLQVAEAHLGIAKKQLGIQEDAFKQKLSDKQEECLQLFRLTNSNKDATYEWYKDRVEDRVDGTCQWFLKHDNFQKWLKQESGPLLVSADPGCGKSVLAKHLINVVLPRSSATIGYFFFKDQDQNTVRQALCALLHQLFSQKPSLIEHAMKHFANDGKGLVNSTSSLWTIFEAVVKDPRVGPVIVVLDALDECAELEFENLMRNVRGQFGSGQPCYGKLKYLLTSRPYEQIVSKFVSLLDAFPHVRIPGEKESDAISQEVNYVIQYRVGQLAGEKSLSSAVKECLERRLLRMPHRTYLWAYLVFDYLGTKDFKKTAKGVESAIATLPATVNDAYEQILRKSTEPSLARKALSIILAASRPLTLSEMNVAVNVDDKSQSFDDLDLEEDEVFQSRLRSCCGLFVSIHHGKIYFLHQTAREFLLADRPPPPTVLSELRWQHSITSRDVHKVLADVCVLYLDFLNSDVIPRTASVGTGQCLQSHTFLIYSAENWGAHVRKACIDSDSAIVPSVLRICNPESESYRAWSDIYWDKSEWYAPSYVTSLVIASHFGHNGIVKQLLEKGADVNARKGDDGWTPLLLAAQQGHEGIVKQLLEKGADVNARKGDYGWTPLSWAAQQGHEGIVKQLLEKGADVNAEDKYDGWTPLLLAAQQGHEGIVKQLLEKGADVNARSGNNGWTPLLLAAGQGYEGIVKQLLEKGADVNAEDKYDGGTPLLLAARQGYEGIVKQLLEKGADGIVKQLLEKGADVNAEDKYDGGTPLLWAAQQGYEGIVKQLLEKGADVNARGGNNGWTPLLFGARQGYEGIVKQLLEKGADVNAEDKYGWTPLLLAARHGYEGIVKQLLEKGADVNAEDKYGWTPLLLAARHGYEGIVKQLLEKGADVNAEDKYGWTPLSWAAEHGHDGIVKQLLDKGAG
ncbi:hypothetical protein QBC40DRAFT_250714 [Triangularia verruculosa]|uniref:NWD NACHT-NTPase N-terminal domain-containing protein n=1 Tax=Triangularia verruculosa TaxID=2587418 RepID=A0AAN6XR32_9PEZI|nr:hypothetical protein QBC40DRAFT_250714 [Triangularia verruculosa]